MATDRPIVRQTVPAMIPPSPEQRAEAAAAGGSMTAHDGFMAAWPCLSSLETSDPPAATPGDQITLAAWNIERCKRVEESAALLRTSGADIVLATEMDLGMARSGQRHTTRDLAEALGFGYVFGVEFVELGPGDAYETEMAAGQGNDHGLHGNAILSRFPIADPALIPLDTGGAWFAQSPKGDGQYRVGGRNAIAARLDTPAGPVTLASVHYESESDAEGRAAQTERLLSGLAGSFGDGACVIGGDLNTAALAGLTGAACIADPQSREPSFAAFARAGFDWDRSNAPDFTTRAAPGRTVRYPLKRLDWILTRGVEASAPRTLPAICQQGGYLSDHEAIVTTLALASR